MGSTVYKIGASKKKVKIIDSRGARKGYGLFMTAKPAPTSPTQDVEPDKTLTKTASITSTFAVTTGTLAYDLTFSYKLDKFTTGMGDITWFPQRGLVSYGAVKYKGPKTHYMEVEIVFQPIKNVGSGKEDMPMLFFQLNQWYGPLIGTGTNAITNGRLYMGKGQVWLQKTKW